MSRLVYVQALAYCGSAEVLKVRKDGRYLIETPSGRTHRVRASDCRDLRAERAPSPPALELVPNVGGEPRAVPKPAPPERVPAYLADTRAIPLCHPCHMGHHSKPLDRELVEDEIAKHLRRWVREMGTE